MKVAASVLFGSACPGLSASFPAQHRQTTIEQKGDFFIQKQAARHQQSGWSSVILKLDGNFTPEKQQRLKSLGCDIYRHLSIIRAVAARVPNHSLNTLANLPFVTRISADATVKKNDEFTVEHSGAGYAFRQYGLTGLGVTVAVVDSGVQNAKDLSRDKSGQAGLLEQVTIISGGKEDRCGHGTHVAGIIAGNGTSSRGKDYFKTFYGIAPRSSIVSVRVLDETGSGSVSDVVSGIQWVIKYRDQYNIRVLNLSVGHPVGESYTTDPLCQAVESAWKSGIVVVCAAGNSGRQQDAFNPELDNEGYGTAYGSIQSPGNDPYVITVGAMKNCNGVRVDDRIATYSSRGPTRLDLILKPDIIAPGNRVISLEKHDSYLDRHHNATNEVKELEYKRNGNNKDSDKYFRLSGTSMAAPVVSGAAALMLQADPTLSPDTLKARLMLSADKWGFPDGTTDPCTFGAGYLNIPAALTCTAVPTMPASSPSLSQDANGNVFVDSTSAIWGNDIFGNRAVWGVAGIDDLRAVWGTNAIWGTTDNVLEASKAIWGSSVWSDKAIWGSTSGAADLTSTAIYGE